MPDLSDFEIRSFGCEESGAMTHISADVGWHQPEAEIREVIRRSGEFLFGAFHGKRLIGTAAAYAYPDAGFAFINEVIVESQFRRRGAAAQLLRKLIPLTEAKYPVLRLYATDMGRPLYEKFGFEPYATLSFLQLPPGETPNPDGDIMPLTQNELAEAAELDRNNFGADRSELIRALMTESPENAWMLRKNGRMTGFIVRGPMSWLLQTGSPDDMTSLIRWADKHSGKESYPVLILQEHAEQLPEKCEVHFKLTAMQRGTADPPRMTFGSMLPDIG